MRPKQIWFLSLCIVFFHCKEAPGENSLVHPVGQRGLSTIFVPADYDTHGSSGKEIAVDVYIPPVDKSAEKKNVCRATILALPGWAFSRTDWHQKTGLLNLADQHQFCVLFPEMEKSIYASSYFPETTRKVFPVPSGQWIVKIFIPYIQIQHKMLLPEQKNLLLGLSTGALTALNTKTLFTAGAALSGDYNQSEMPYDKLMTAVYGPYQQNEYRWKTIDNPHTSAAKFMTNLYLGHGKKDKVTPFDQTEKFYNELKRVNHKITVVFEPRENAEHNYDYWGSELESVFHFYEKFLQEKQKE